MSAFNKVLACIQGTRIIGHSEKMEILNQNEISKAKRELEADLKRLGIN